MSNITNRCCSDCSSEDDVNSNDASIEKKIDSTSVTHWRIKNWELFKTSINWRPIVMGITFIAFVAGFSGVLYYKYKSEKDYFTQIDPYYQKYIDIQKGMEYTDRLFRLQIISYDDYFKERERVRKAKSQAWDDVCRLDVNESYVESLRKQNMPHSNCNQR